MFGGNLRPADSFTTSSLDREKAQMGKTAAPSQKHADLGCKDVRNVCAQHKVGNASCPHDNNNNKSGKLSKLKNGCH